MPAREAQDGDRLRPRLPRSPPAEKPPNQSCVARGIRADRPRSGPVSARNGATHARDALVPPRVEIDDLPVTTRLVLIDRACSTCWLNRIDRRRVGRHDCSPDQSRRVPMQLEAPSDGDTRHCKSHDIEPADYMDNTGRLKESLTGRESDRLPRHVRRLNGSGWRLPGHRLGCHACPFGRLRTRESHTP